MRVVSWNMNKRREGNWEWVINELKPDYVCVQEASPLPNKIKATICTTTKKSNRSAFYSKLQNHEKIKMSTVTPVLGVPCIAFTLRTEVADITIG